jgi:tetratricopeptide (TPR) repeat protein
MGALPRPDVAPGPHRELVDALHDLHHRAGWPSLRRLAGDTGVSHTTVSKVFSSPSVPTWGTLELLVEAMDGDVSHVHDLWLAASTPAPPGGRPRRIAGRVRELTAVQHHLGSGSGLLLVTGEPGIGKTTLVNAAAEGVDTRVVVGRCLRLSREVPLLPVVDVLRSMLGIEDGRWVEQALSDCPAYVRTSLGRLLPELDAVTTEPPQDDPWGLERLYLSITAVLDAVRTTHPLAVHLEDAHWADRSTLDLLSHLASAPPRCALVVTWRSGDPDVSATHDEWLARARWTSGVPAVDLGPLTLAETAEQLRLLTGSSADTHAVQRIHARSEGLPLYTEQLASTPDGSALPQHLVDLLDRRIGDLDDATWRVARVLGVAQRRIGPALLRTASGLDADHCTAGLRRLAGRRLLRPDTADDAELAHPLLVDAVQRRLLPGEGAQVHARLAEALSEEPGVEPAEVADHWRAAGRPGREVGHRVAAATRARDRFAHQEALEAWLRVLELWDAGIPADGMTLWDVLAPALDSSIEVGDLETSRALVARSVGLDLPDQQRGAMLRLVGAFLVDDGKAQEGLALLDEALALLERHPPSPELLEVLVERMNFFLQSGRYDDAQAAVRRREELFGDEADPRTRRRWQASSIWLAARDGHLERAVATARDVLGDRYAGQDPFADLVIAANATWVMFLANLPPREIGHLARGALRAADASNLTESYPSVLVRINIAVPHLNTGDLVGARDALAPVTSSAPSLNTADAHVVLAAIELREGHLNAALERWRRADAQVSNHNQNWAEGVHWHVEGLLWAGRDDLALELLDEAIEVSLPTEAVSNTVPLLCLRARALADQLDRDGAARAERKAVAQQLRRLAAGAPRDPFEAGPPYAAMPAMGHLWQAELARACGDPAVHLWVAAAVAFDRLSWSHDAAYCRWRAAGSALQHGEGTRAARLLARAAAQARHHAPLTAAITTTAANRSGDSRRAT